MQEYNIDQVFQFPPASLDTSIVPIQSPYYTVSYADPLSTGRQKYTSWISGQPWGNGAYEVKVSSTWTEYEQNMWKMFDQITDTYDVPHFDMNHYSTETGDFLLGSASGYTLDGLYFGELPEARSTHMLRNIAMFVAKHAGSIY
jgi:hypothetical protein